MNGFAKVMILGNLTRDVQLKNLPGGTVCAEFGVACNRKFRTAQGEDREEVTFVDCTAFGKTGEVIGRFFTKGKPIIVDGRLKYETWESKDGGKRSKLTVVVDNFHFLPDGKGGQNDRAGNAEPPAAEGNTLEAAAADIPF